MAALLRAIFTQAAILPLSTAVSFLPPTGPYNTTITTHQLTDSSRIDPFSSTNASRTLMISAFHAVSPSACKPSLAPYLDPTTTSFEDTKFAQYGLPAGTFELLSLPVCQPRTTFHHQQNSRKPESFPLVLFSPALGTSRLFYTILAQQIASTGYTVLTIDHPYDADIVVFPDNSTILGSNIETDADVLLAISTRVADISFILNHLFNPRNAKTLLPSLTHPLSLHNVGIFGHSLGGASSASVMLSDSRLVGGINLDGSFLGPALNSTLSRPFMLFGHSGKDTTTDSSWEIMWANLRGWKRDLMLADSAHYTFSDLPDIVDVLGIRGQLPSAVVDGMLGSIGGGRALEVVSAYVGAFFDRVLKGKRSSLLDEPSEEFPEVTFGSP